MTHTRRKLASLRLLYRARRMKILLLALLALGGCAGLGFNVLYGPEAPRTRQVDTLADEQVDYWTSVKPIMENRCTVCHGCYDAPCQLNLTSIEGIERGAHKNKIYNLTRLSPANLTRLHEDADSVEQWRNNGFFPVLNERENSQIANREAGVMYRLLALKEQHPLPEKKLLPNEITLGNDRKQSCSRSQDIDKYTSANPLWGMPYALPGIEPLKQEVLKKWLDQGANYTPRTDLAQPYLEQIRLWEEFLNQDSMKGQLVNRYLYEHLFLAHLHFGDNSPVFFKLVRSSSPPGQPLARIATRRPYDDPGIERVYYRLSVDVESVVVKTHMPYLLNADRLERWQSLFFETKYTVKSLPGYDVAIAANPFASFEQLPVQSRYQFLLDEAQFTIMNFIKGPVCRGQVALNVIKDHFWVYFVDPEYNKEAVLAQFFQTQKSALEMPNAKGDTLNPLLNWRKYSKKQTAMLLQKDKYMSENLSAPGELDLAIIWDGDQKNENAALTVFRHFDSATVEKGLVGAPPQTAWLLGYSELERIHYLLVAGYDVYGNLGHQLLSRLYMDFLRMEGEANFLALLPNATRQTERDNWYREADPELLTYISNPGFEKEVEPSINYKTENHKMELFQLIATRLGGALSQRRSLNKLQDTSLVTALKKLSNFQGEKTKLLPEVSYVEIAGAGQSDFITMMRNNAHLNITSMFGEATVLSPEENTLSVVPGFVGAYPNVFMKVAREDIDDFVSRVTSLQTNEDYTTLLDDFGIRRTNKEFWQHSDKVHQALQADNAIEYGLLDFNRLENR
jgi:hypothetical protein